MKRLSNKIYTSKQVKKIIGDKTWVRGCSENLLSNIEELFLQYKTCQGFCRKKKSKRWSKKENEQGLNEC